MAKLFARILLLLITETVSQDVSQTPGKTWILDPGPVFQFIPDGSALDRVAGGVNTRAAGHIQIPFVGVFAI
jgi:hypothetical protein